MQAFPSFAPLEGDASANFEEALGVEVFVDLERLRALTRRGIPDKYRAALYRFFLGVSSVDKSGELASSRRQEETFLALLPANPLVAMASGLTRAASGGAMNGVAGTRGGAAVCSRSGLCLSVLARVERYFRDAGITDALRKQRLLQVVHALAAVYVDASPEVLTTITALALPFESLYTNAHDVFFCARAVVSVLQSPGNALCGPWALMEHCGFTLAILRATNLTLYTHMANEGLSFFSWLPDMLASLLVNQMPLGDVRRLWDSYIRDALSEGGGGFALHPYVCLAILLTLTDRLTELDHDSMLSVLRALPPLRIEEILRSAVLIREEVRAKGLA